MPCAASVHGLAPIITNTAVAGSWRTLPSPLRRLTLSTVAEPCTAVTSVSVSTSMWGERSMRSMR